MPTIALSRFFVALPNSIKYHRLALGHPLPDRPAHCHNAAAASPRLYCYRACHYSDDDKTNSAPLQSLRPISTRKTDQYANTATPNATTLAQVLQPRLIPPNLSVARRYRGLVVLR